jgi:hypothetical protein
MSRAWSLSPPFVGYEICPWHSIILSPTTPEACLVTLSFLNYLRRAVGLLSEAEDGGDWNPRGTRFVKKKEPVAYHPKFWLRSLARCRVDPLFGSGCVAHALTETGRQPFRNVLSSMPRCAGNPIHGLSSWTHWRESRPACGYYAPVLGPFSFVSTDFSTTLYFLLSPAAVRIRQPSNYAFPIGSISRC